MAGAIGTSIAKGERKMPDSWEEKLTCALRCARCDGTLAPTDQRILSVYDHEPICMTCKAEEETRPDYADVSKQTIGQLMGETELLYSDPKGYCYHHFYPFRC